MISYVLCCITDGDDEYNLMCLTVDLHQFDKVVPVYEACLKLRYETHMYAK